MCVFIDAVLLSGAVFYITSKEMRLETGDAHYIILMAKKENNYFHCICTSRHNSVKNRYKVKGLSISNIPCISPNKDNGLKTYTYIDGSFPINQYTYDDIKKMINKGTIKYKGRISSKDFIETVNKLKYTKVHKGFLINMMINNYEKY